MPFSFTPCRVLNKGASTTIPGLYEIAPRVFGDSRGYFYESYNYKDFKALGLDLHFVQANQSSSIRGVLRGLHFQTAHPQGKLVRAVLGRVYDVAVDLRSPSPTFGKYYAVILDANRCNMFYIPEGFAHGFIVLSEKAIFTYQCTDFYDPKGEGGLIWNDKSLAIDWAAADQRVEPILSPKDALHPSFDPTCRYFDMQGKWLG